MLLQKALRELDGEIDRLGRIRAIVASLETSSSFTDMPAPVSIAPFVENLPQLAPVFSGASASDRSGSESVLQSTTTPRKNRKLRLERTTRTHRPPPPVARALGGTIPAQPVFIAAKGNGRSLGDGKGSLPPKQMPPPVAQEGTLDALLRELSYRPSASS